jgi:hypothetical protein
MKKSIFYLFILVLFGRSNLASGQMTEGDTLRLGFRATVTGSWITGNVERLLVNSNLEVSHMNKTVGLKTSNTYTYGTIFKRETENDIFSRNFFYVFPRKRLYPYAMLWWQNSARQQIEYRYQAGVGVSYSVLRKTHHQIKISTTFSREETKYNGESFFIQPRELRGRTVPAWRGTLRILGHHQLIGDRVRLSYETWYQPAWNDPNNWRYYLNASLDVPISKRVAFRSSIVYVHENIVLNSIKRDDKSVSFGLTLTNL